MRALDARAAWLERHLGTSIHIPRSSEHLESDRDTPEVSEAGAIINPPGPGAYESRVGLAALTQKTNGLNGAGSSSSSYYYS